MHGEQRRAHCDEQRHGRDGEGLGFHLFKANDAGGPPAEKVLTEL
jgi:hypothetical protein